MLDTPPHGVFSDVNTLSYCLLRMSALRLVHIFVDQPLIYLAGDSSTVYESWQRWQNREFGQTDSLLHFETETGVNIGQVEPAGCFQGISHNHGPVSGHTSPLDIDLNHLNIQQNVS